MPVDMYMDVGKLFLDMGLLLWLIPIESPGAFGVGEAATASPAGKGWGVRGAAGGRLNSLLGLF